MLRVLLLASLCATISASVLPGYVLEYPENLQRLFGGKGELGKEGRQEEREVCRTKECQLIAQLIKESMDQSVDPCDDFYEYACGNWSNLNELPENMTQWSLWDMVMQKVDRQVSEIISSQPKSDDLFAVKLAKKWYHSCMDTEAIERRGVEPILSTLWRHGGWPLIMEDGEWDDAVYHWQIVDDHFARLIGFNAFHDLRYSRLSFRGNESILVDTPHLPIASTRLLSYEKRSSTDTSDENNESGEGSQEKGSKERGQAEEDDENEDEAEEAEKEGDAEEREERRISRGRKHKRLSHPGRSNRRRSSLDKSRQRDRRDVSGQRAHHRGLPSSRKAQNRNKVHHSARGRSSKSAHRTYDKLSTKRNHLENRGRGKHSKVSHGKGHRIEENYSTGKKTGEVHSRSHHGHQRVADHGAHRSNHVNVLKHKRLPVAESDEDKDEDKDEDNEVDTGNGDEDEDDDDVEEDGNNENEEEKDDEDDEEENENDGDADDQQEGEENNEEAGEEKADDEDEEDSEARRQEIRALYTEHILNVSLVLSKGRGIEIAKEQLLKDINDLIDFTIKVGQLTIQEDPPARMKLDELQTLYDKSGPSTPRTKINWVGKIRKLFAEAGVDLKDNVNVTVVAPRYIENLRDLIEQTPSKVIVNYIHWLFVSKAIMAGPEELKNLGVEWVQGSMFPSRESECIELVQLSRVAGYEYVKQYFSEDIAKSARDMIDDIQKEVEYQIKDSTWMDDDTKHFVLDKLVHMKNLVGYPEWYENTTLVKQYFHGLTIGPSYYENLLNYVRYIRWKNLRKIVDVQREDDDYSEMMDPLELNAFFLPTENTISITAADFQSPFFAHSRPWYVNFGIIGLVMAHEVNHGFDNEGHLYDKEGNHMEWLSAMAEAYNQRAECFVDQYNKYNLLKGENFTVENYGNQTAGENIADSMGLLAVYRAYKRRERECGKQDPALPGLEDFTNDQVFFLSFANLWCEITDREDVMMRAKYDVHSISRLRVIGPASNSPDFAKAFDCPVGSPMNPKRKCDIWK